MRTRLSHLFRASAWVVRPDEPAGADDADATDWRRVAIVLGLVIVVVTPAWFWYDSLFPRSFSVLDIGQVDLGGGSDEASGNHFQHGGISVAELTGDTAGPPDVAVTLTAREQRFRLATGETVDGYTVNNSSPGPELRFCQGDLVAVTLHNESVDDGVTLHWHGVDLPNAADGVAGVTQDAVKKGADYTYRFRADDTGTYWYHSHQVSDPQVRGGLFGAVVVDPAQACHRDHPLDTVAVVHTYAGIGTVNGRTGTQRITARPGDVVRVRVVNTENATITVSVFGASFRVLAIDGRDVNQPTDLRARTIPLAAGGRVDLAVTAPADGSAARLDLGAGAGVMLAIGPANATIAPVHAVDGTVDFLSYGTPAVLGFQPQQANRHFDYRIGRRYGFFNGRLGNWWTVNGRYATEAPMFMVSEGDVVVMRISNKSGSTHPIHLHGHHAVVLERNGARATGSPWWIDSVDVETGSTYVIAFIADNPGIWLDHCHNLTHAAQGLSVHIAYFGVTEPFKVGSASGNHPQ